MQRRLIFILIWLILLLVFNAVFLTKIKASSIREESLRILVLSTESHVDYLDEYGYPYDIKPPSALESFVPKNYSVIYVRERGVPVNDAQRQSLLWALGNGTGVIEDQRTDYLDGPSTKGTHLLEINSTYIGTYQNFVMILNGSHFITEPLIPNNGTCIGWGMYSREAYFDESVTPLVETRTVLAYQNASTLNITAPLLVVGTYGKGRIFFMNMRPYKYHNYYFQKTLFHRAISWVSKHKIGIFLGPMPNGYDSALSWRWDDIGHDHWDTKEEYQRLYRFFNEVFSYGIQGTFLIVIKQQLKENNVTEDYLWVKQLLKEGKVSYEIHGTIDGHVLMGEYDNYDNYSVVVEALYQGCVLLNETLGEWPLALMPPAWHANNNTAPAARACGLHYDRKTHHQPLITNKYHGPVEYYKQSPHLPYDYQYLWGDDIFWDNSEKTPINEIRRILSLQRLRFAFYMPLCHPNYQLTDESKHKNSRFTWDDTMNRTRGVAIVLKTDDGLWWKTDMKEMMEWIYIRNHQAKPNITSVTYDPSARKITVQVEVNATINGLTLIIPNSLDLDVDNYTVDGVEEYFMPTTHQNTARVVLPKLEAGSHILIIYLGTPKTPRLTFTEGWHYPNITDSSYSDEVLTINLSSPQEVNLTIACAGKGKPHRIEGGKIVEYDSSSDTVKIYVYATTVRITWATNQVTESYIWGFLVAAGVSLAYWILRRKKPKG
ncbi:MAG: hypothetical protein ACTSV7_07685 [Candidatus Baldrarchaeia archaeon]